MILIYLAIVMMFMPCMGWSCKLSIRDQILLHRLVTSVPAPGQVKSPPAAMEDGRCALLGPNIRIRPATP